MMGVGWLAGAGNPFSGLTKDLRNLGDKTTRGNAGKTTMGATLSLTYLDQDVGVVIGASADSTPDLDSGADISVSAIMTEYGRGFAKGVVVVPSGASTGYSAPSSGTSHDGSGGRVVGLSGVLRVFFQDVHATVGGNATLDAAGTISVESRYHNPWNFSPVESNDPAVTYPAYGWRITDIFLGGTEGLMFYVTHSWADTKAFVTPSEYEGRQPSVTALALAVTVHFTTSTATIQSGARINRDPIFRADGGAKRRGACRDRCRSRQSRRDGQLGVWEHPRAPVRAGGKDRLRPARDAGEPYERTVGWRRGRLQLHNQHDHRHDRAERRNHHRPVGSSRRPCDGEYVASPHCRQGSAVPEPGQGEEQRPGIRRQRGGGRSSERDPGAHRVGCRVPGGYQGRWRRQCQCGERYPALQLRRLVLAWQGRCFVGGGLADLQLRATRHRSVGGPRDNGHGRCIARHRLAQVIDRRLGHRRAQRGRGLLLRPCRQRGGGHRCECESSRQSATRRGGARGQFHARWGASRRSPGSTSVDHRPEGRWIHGGRESGDQLRRAVHQGRPQRRRSVRRLHRRHRSNGQHQRGHGDRRGRAQLPEKARRRG